MTSPLFQRLALFSTGLTLIVIVLGAWVRLTDAGLGCPDWPGCYGMVTWPSTPETIERADQVRLDRAVDSGAAFREMLHRYVAGFLGLVVLAIAAIAWRNRRQPGQPVRLPMVLLALIIFQSALGAWTVTMLLKPAIVMAHLMGGMTTFILLLWLTLRVYDPGAQPSMHARRHRGPIIFGTVLVALQVALGGWVSTNYAALSCGSDFPTCLGQWWPEMNFREGFVLWREVGVDYEGGLLDQSARVAIHLAHRIGAVVIVAYFAWLIWRLVREPVLRTPGVVLGIVLAAQVALGVLNVVLGLPLSVAVAHNGVAAILLGVLFYLIHRTTSAARTDGPGTA